MVNHMVDTYGMVDLNGESIHLKKEQQKRRILSAEGGEEPSMIGNPMHRGREKKWRAREWSVSGLSLLDEY